MQEAYAQTSSSRLADFNFAAVGDWGCNSNTKSTVNNMISKSPELVLGLGDYSYQNTANCWIKMVEEIDQKMKISIGNHDDQTLSLLGQHLGYFGLTKQYYSFNYQNVHFVVMSTELPYTADSDQYNFVKSDLAKAQADPEIAWIVVYFHKPMYTSASSHGASSSLRNTYHPLFDAYGVDLVLQGHNHNYQRSYPIKYNSANPSSPTITETKTNNYDNDPQGQIYSTVGTGGISLYAFSGKASYIVYQQSSSFGFLNIDIVNDGTVLNAKYYDNFGRLHDEFTITKPYRYTPSLALFGSNYQDMANSNSLQLSKFSVATWFKTTMDYSSTKYIVNKGGSGQETAGTNMNYGIWMRSSETIVAGFETTAGINYNVRTTDAYNDGKWHYAIITYDGFYLRLYIDGAEVAAGYTGGAIPDSTGTQPVRIGANSLTLNGFFTGNVDEIRIWNRALSSAEIAEQYKDGIFMIDRQVLYQSFGN